MGDGFRVEGYERRDEALGLEVKVLGFGVKGLGVVV